MSEQSVKPFSLESPQWQEAISENSALAPFFDNLESFLDLPNGVEKLRSVILDLAVRGKLVKQDPEGELASTLLEKIGEQRQALLKAKKIRRVKVEPILDVPFDLPPSWSWSRLAHATLNITDGTHHSPTNSDRGEFKYVTAKNIKTDGVQLSNVTFVTKEVHDEIYDRCNPELHDLLYIKDGATTGIVTINDLDEPFSMLSSVALLKRPDEIEPKFLLYVLRSPYFYDLMRADMTGVAITRVTLAKLNKALIPVAPLAEQRRIVSKVESLMSLCDTLESQRHAREGVRERASRSVLASLTSPLAYSPTETTSTETQPASSTTGRTGSPSGLHKVKKSTKVPKGEMIKSSWQRLSDHFEVLMDSPETLIDLRQSILQLAVQGRLGPQDHSDEPARDALGRVQAELLAAVKLKTMRKPKAIPEYEESYPYELPVGWTWTQLGYLVVAEDNAMCDGPFGSKLKTSHYVPSSDYAVIRLGNIGIGKFLWGKEGYIPKEHYESLPANHVRVGDLIMAGMASPIARCCEVPSSLGKAVNKADCFRLRVHAEVNRSYVRIFLNSPVAIAFAAKENHGMTRQRINLSNAKAMPVPLPPLAEQKRIVINVSALLSQLDQASELRDTREKKTTTLMDSLIDQILGVERKIPIPMNDVKNTKVTVTLKSDSLKTAKEPISSAKEVINLFKKKGDQTTPDQLLSATKLAEDVDIFFQLLREARDDGSLEFSEGFNQPIRRIK